MTDFTCITANPHSLRDSISVAQPRKRSAEVSSSPCRRHSSQVTRLEGGLGQCPSHTQLPEEEAVGGLSQVCFYLHSLQRQSVTTSHWENTLRPTGFLFFSSILACRWVFGGMKVIFQRLHCVSALPKHKLLEAYSDMSARRGRHAARGQGLICVRASGSYL